MEKSMELVEQKWNDILQSVKEEYELTDVSYNTWLKPLDIYAIQDNKVFILVPSEQMGLNYINKKYYLPIKVTIAEMTGIEYDVEFVLPEQAKQIRPVKPKKNTMRESSENSNLNPNYTFDTFIVGSNNRFAHSASLAVAESPGEVYNPLFIYGGAGLGKTHLMHAIAHFIQTEHPELKVLYVTSETFTNELIESIRNGNNSAITKFRDTYRNIDVLLIDDIQFIIGKESTQEEFFHTFNELHIAKKQIIISSDRPPREIETLEDRLRSRFDQGLTADIQTPDLETRMAILRTKAASDNIVLPTEVITLLATNIATNIREIEGAYNKIVAYTSLMHMPITVETAQKVLSDMGNDIKTRTITYEGIIKVVADHYNVKQDELFNKKRTQNIAFPRQVAMYLCRELADLSYPRIGELFGGRDHTTVIHAYEKISNFKNSNLAFQNELQEIIEILRQ